MVSFSLVFSANHEILEGDVRSKFLSFCKVALLSKEVRTSFSQDESGQ